MYQKSVTSSPRSTAPTSASGDSAARLEREVGRQRPERAGAGHRVARRRRAERLGSAAVVDEAARDTRLHELVAALRGSLRVEADANRHRVRDVVGEGDPRVELRFAQAGEGTALVDGAAVEAVDAQKGKDVGDAGGRQDDLVRAGLEVGGVGSVAGQAGRLLTDSGPIEIGELRRRGARRSVRAAGPGDPVEHRGRRATGDALAGGVGERGLDALGRAEAGGLESLRRAHEGRDSLGTRPRRRLGRRIVPMVDRRRLGLGRQAGPTGIDRLEPRGVERGSHQARQCVVIGLVGGRLGDPPVQRHAQVKGAGRIGDVLVDEARREPGQRLGAGGDGDLGLCIGTDQAQDALADLEEGFRAHQRTPTRTPRNRHGTAGWPVWPICPGWPFPQFGVPQNVHSVSLPSMSRLCQKRGPMPV